MKLTEKIVATLQLPTGVNERLFGDDDLIPNPIDQNPWAHWRSPMDMMRQG